MTLTTRQRNVKRGKLFYFLLWSSSVLLVLCCSLVTAIILLRNHYVSCGVSAGEPRTGITLTHSGKVIHLVEDMESVNKPWQRDYRLPLDTDPIHYDILLHPDLKNFTFNGEVLIQIKVKVARTFLLVHTKNLNIYETKLTRLVGVKNEDHAGRKKVVGEETDVEIEDTFEYKPNEFWVVMVRNELEPAIYNLRLKFNGTLSGKIVGFYRSICTDSKTKDKRAIATTKFQPTYARQAYPCFDEPGFKSTFTIRIVRPRDGYSALSNMDQTAESVDSPEPGLTTVEFRESVPMVTYLSCFIVSDFERLQPVTISEGFPFSVYATPAQVEKTKYALDVGVNITEYFIEYFGIPYPLPKLDMVAIPDYSSGATEHWGIITYREVNLLYEEGVSSTVNMQRVAVVISHELAHMWFGNLMTLDWWDDLWLNEGFASYVQYKGVDHAHPDWQILDQFLFDLHSVMVIDASVTSHPIVQPVNHPDEINELFNAISYNKGASVIRMLEDFMGEEAFKTGINKFLNRFKFANAVTQDLWDVLDAVAEDVNITHVMDTWIRQMGFPVVTAKRESNGDYTLVQERFLSDPEAEVKDDSPYGYRWDIPITYITSQSKEVKREWLYSDSPSVTLNVPLDVSWIKINSHHKGYYRVNYEEENWNQLSELLKNDLTALDIPDRAHLLDDIFSLAEADLINYNLAMDMTRYLASETAYVPWSVASTKFNRLNTLLVAVPSYAKLRKYVQSLVSGIYKKVTMTVSDNDSHVDRLLRPTIVGLACDMGLQESIDEAVAVFQNWINNLDTVPKPHPDMRNIIYSYGLKYTSNVKEWDIIWNMYLDETDAQERIKLLYGLAHSSEPWILHRYIQYTKNENYIRSQDVFTVLGYISRNPVGTPIVWDFVRNEWEYLVDRFTLNDRYLGRLIPTVTSTFTTNLKIEEMETFFEKYPDAGAGRTARSQALDTVKKNRRWLNLHKKILDEWLDEAIADL